jgi:hypothetical protein
MGPWIRNEAKDDADYEAKADKPFVPVPERHLVMRDKLAKS